MQHIVNVITNHLYFGLFSQKRLLDSRFFYYGKTAEMTKQVEVEKVEVKEVEIMEVEENIFFPSDYSPSGCPTVPLVFSGMTGR